MIAARGRSRWEGLLPTNFESSWPGRDTAIGNLEKRRFQLPECDNPDLIPTQDPRRQCRIPGVARDADHRRELFEQLLEWTGLQVQEDRAPVYRRGPEHGIERSR